MRKIAKPIAIETVAAMNSKAIATPETGLDEIGREQQGDDEAGEDCGRHREADGARDQAHAPVEDPQFAEPAVVLAAAALEQQRLDVARAVDDPRQARRADVEEGTDRR